MEIKHVTHNIQRQGDFGIFIDDKDLGEVVQRMKPLGDISSAVDSYNHGRIGYVALRPVEVKIENMGQATRVTVSPRDSNNEWQQIIVKLLERQLGVYEDGSKRD